MKPNAETHESNKPRGPQRTRGRPSKFRGISLILLLLFLAQLGSVKTQPTNWVGKQMYSAVLAADPKQVSRKDAKLSLLVEPLTEIPAGAHVVLTLPDTGEVSFTAAAVSGAPRCEMLGLSTPVALSCNIVRVGGTDSITWITKEAIPRANAVQFWVLGGFNNPRTTEPTSTFVLGIYTDASRKEGLDRQVSDLSVTATAESLARGHAYLRAAAGGTGEVGKPTKAVLHVRAAVLLPPGAVIEVHFPRYTTEAPASLQKGYLVDAATTTCKAIRNVAASLKCTVTEDEDSDGRFQHLKITGALPSGTSSAGQDLAIEIDRVYNPLSLFEREFPAAISAQGRAKRKLYSIEEGTVGWRATTPTSISGVSVRSTDTTVQEYVDYTIEFQPDVDIEAGAHVRLQFPSGGARAYYSFDNRLDSMRTSGGLFGSRQDSVSFKVEAANLRIETKDGTPLFRLPSKAEITLGKIKNPAYVGSFGSFSIRVYDKNRELIAQVDDGATYATTSGGIVNIKLYPENPLVDSKSKLHLEFAPLHEVAKDSKLKIEITDELTMGCPPKVFVYNSPQLVRPLRVSCPNVAGYTAFVIDKPYVNDYAYSEGQALKIVFTDSTLPYSARGISKLRLSTLTAAGALVDFHESDGSVDLFIVDPAPFYRHSVRTLAAPKASAAVQDETYTDSAFEFSLTFANILLAGGYIDMTLPPEVRLPSSGPAVAKGTPQLTGTGFAATSSKLPASHQVHPNGTVTVRVTDIVKAGSSKLGKGASIKFALSWLRTPLTTESSGSFKIFTKDSKGRIVNYVITDLLITMLKGKHIPSLEVRASNYIVGATAAHSFSFATPVPLAQADRITVVYNGQTFLPIKGGRCTGGDSLSAGQSCTVIQDVVSTGGLVFRSSSSLEVGAKLSLTIYSGENPKTGQRTGIFKVFVKDKRGYVKAQMTEPSLEAATLRMTIPASVRRYSLSPVDGRQLAVTAFKLKFTSTLPYPKGSYLEIGINSKEMGPRNADDRAAVTCSSNLQLQLTCTFLTDDLIKVSGMFAEDLVEGSQIFLMITNFYIAVQQPLTTKSWTVTVHTAGGDIIDRIGSGLHRTFQCYSPCETCSASNPRSCLSCNVLTGKTILYKNDCLNKCPALTYYDAAMYTCATCHSNCLGCDPYHGDRCTSCKPNGPLPFLDGTACRAVCPFGTYGDKTTNKCEPCRAPCQSCTNSADDCSSCDISAGSAAKYFMQGVCKDKCEDGYTVPLRRKDFVCEKCSSNCATCAGDNNHCLSCKKVGKTYLSLLDNTCHDQCPSGVTVPLPGPAKHCGFCSSVCNTCSGVADHCTSCKQDYSLLRTAAVGSEPAKSTCVKECSKQSVDGLRSRLVSINSECTACADPCLQCENSASRCLTCRPGQYMLDYKCLPACPEKYSPRTTILEDGKTAVEQCVLTGFYCRFGYEMNAARDACFLKAQICEGSDVLNYDKTRCIPKPEILVPFPLTILAIIGAAVIVWDKRKHPQSRFYANMICLLSALETVGLLFLVGLSADYGIKPSFSLSFCALMFLYGLNLFFFLIYLKQLKLDSAFKYWEQEFELSTMAIVVASLLGNFKLYRLFYSRFHEKKQFNAVFQDDEVFYRAIMFTSIFYILTGSLPILVASIFSLFYIKFGYQLHMFCIELIAVEIVLMLLISIELYKLRKYILQKSYLKVSAKEMKKENQFKVRSGAMDEDLLHGQVGDKGEATTKILLRLLQRINVKDAGKRKREEYTTIREIEELHEEEFRQHQLRRCISFKEVREYQDDDEEFQRMIAESDSDDDGPRYNYISEPSSPRSKEMLQNPNFHLRMNELSKAYSMRDQYDNCYHEGRPLHTFAYKKCKMVSRTVQTNVLELLGVDDLMPQYSKNIGLIRQRDQLNQKIDEESVDEGDDLDEAARLLSKGMFQNVLDNFEGFQEKKKRKQLPVARLRQLPQFEIEELVGEFEIDEEGNYIIIGNGQDAQGKDVLEDLNGRRVNARGYLVNGAGMVITRKGTVVFRADEVDSDGEIPAPFCYMKNKDSLGMGQQTTANMFGPNGMRAPNVAPVDELDEEDELVEKEFQRIRGAAVRPGAAAKRTPADIRSERSLRSDEFDYDDQHAAPSKLIQKMGKQPVLYNPNDEDFIANVSKPMKPKSKQEYLKQIKARTGQDALGRSRAQKAQRSDRRPGLVAPMQLSNEQDPTHGTIGETFFKKMNQTIGDGDLDQRQRQTHDSRPGDLDPVGSVDDRNVELANRPLAGGKKAPKKKRILRADQRKILARDDTELTAMKIREREQQILEGMERFQEMLNRYPMQPKQHRSSNTLANKNLERVYGKIKQQYAKSILIPDPYEGNAGGLQTPSQFRGGLQGRVGHSLNRSSRLGTNPSQSSLHPDLAGFPSSGKPSQRLGQPDKLRGLAQIYQPSNRKNTKGRSHASNVSAKSQSRMSAGPPNIAPRGGQGNFRSIENEDNYLADDDRQMLFSGSSQDRQQAMFQTGPPMVREELPSPQLAAASPSGDPALQAFFKSNSSMADHEALLQKHDDTIDNEHADEHDRLNMEGTGTGLLKETFL